MSREALVLLVCCCDFRDGAERLIPSKSLRNAVIRAFPGLFRILRMCAPRRAAAVVRPRERKKSADRRRRILISRLLIIRASVPRRKSPFPAYFKGFPAVSPLIPPYPAFLKYPVSPQTAMEQIGEECIPVIGSALKKLSDETALLLEAAAGECHRSIDDAFIYENVPISRCYESRARFWRGYDGYDAQALWEKNFYTPLVSRLAACALVSSSPSR